MRKGLITVTLTTTAALPLAGCGSAPEVNTNAARNAANSAAGTVENAANSVANAVSKVATESPADFLKNASQGGMMEVEMAKLATTKAQHPDLKKFAEVLVADHTRVNTEVKALAGQKNVTLPPAADMDKSDIEDMRKLSGAAFDKAFIEAMTDDHENDIAAFGRQAENATDAEVKAFAAKTLPTLRSHLEKIKAIHAKIVSSVTMDN